MRSANRVIADIAGHSACYLTGEKNERKWKETNEKKSGDRKGRSVFRNARARKGQKISRSSSK